MLVLQAESLARTIDPDRADIVIRVPGHKPIIVRVCEIRDGYKVRLGFVATGDVEINRASVDEAKHGWKQTEIV